MDRVDFADAEDTASVLAVKRLRAVRLFSFFGSRGFRSEVRGMVTAQEASGAAAHKEDGGGGK